VDSIKSSTSVLQDATKSFHDSSFDRFLESQVIIKHTHTHNLESHPSISKAIDSIVKFCGEMPDDQLPREIQLLVIHLDKLQYAIRELLLETKTFSGHQKLAYNEQLKKLREISNQAIRNAIQIERDSMHQKLSTYRVERETKLVDERKMLESQLLSCKNRIGDLDARLADAKQQLGDQDEKHRSQIEEHVRFAVDRVTEENQRNFHQYQLDCTNREANMKKDHDRMIARLEAQYKVWDTFLSLDIQALICANYGFTE
jgi:hypothetical protein